MKIKYGHTIDGKKIKAPKGWTLLPEGVKIPSMHREYHEMYSRGEWYGQWVEPRRCHSTMTPMETQVCGSVRVFAIPK